MAEILKFGKVKGRACGGCEQSVFVGDGDGDAGSCHHFPPVPIMVMTQNAIGQPVPMIQPVFAPVFRSDWCAQWVGKKD